MEAHPYGWLSLLPPIVAIVLAIATRRAVLSLLAGIFCGALLTTGGQPLAAIYDTCEIHLWPAFTDPGKLRVFSFTLLMGAMIGVICGSGGMQGLIGLIAPLAKTRRGGQLITWLLGLVVFFDDYANTMLLGNTLRPLCDRLKISREKLAYLVDSTAAPVAGLALVSTWVAVEIDYVREGIEILGPDAGLQAIDLFLASIPYRFYVVMALLFIPLIALSGRDFGPMLSAERRRLHETGDEVLDTEPVATGQGELANVPPARWYNAVLPIALTLSMVMILLYVTGRQGYNSAVEAARVSGETASAPAPASEPVSEIASEATLATDATTATPVKSPALREILKFAQSSLALQYGSLAGLTLAIFLARVQNLMTGEAIVEAVAGGVRVVLPAILILWSATAMSRMTSNKSFEGVLSSTPYEFRDHRLYTGEFLTQAILPDAAQQEGGAASSTLEGTAKMLPTAVFLLAAVLSFSTGTSFGTMGILMPMVVTLTHSVLLALNGVVTPDDAILLACIGSVLAGAIFGDHCSPISDTTILSSQSSGCDHIGHVVTQLPYSLAVAAVAVLCGTIPIGWGWSVWLVLPLQLVALVGVVLICGKKA